MSQKPNLELRQSTIEDLDFLYKVSTLAMRDVSAILDKDKLINEAHRFDEYKNKFDPQKIAVIVFYAVDIGRLRVVKTSDEIYIGGIQILPEYQGLGIGTKIFENITKEAKIENKTIKLEVHKVNTKAIKFYKKLGFVVTSETEKQFIMKKYD
jgi:ribosomal protein S18 acetylase RimI-like enzyme